jgi:hypothetical protein
MTKFAKTGGAVSVAVVLTLISSAHTGNASPSE